MLLGHNQDLQYEHSLDHHLEFWSKAGSLFTKALRGRRSFAPYGGDSAEVSALQLFQPMWILKALEDRITSMQLLFWLRDPRGGAGNRSGFRECIKWLATDAPDGQAWLVPNLPRILDYGRADDLKVLFGTPLESHAASLWKDRIMKGDHYALKWAKRDLVPLQRAFATNEAGLRKVLRQPARRTVETDMCARNWAGINYQHVPSVAMARYTKAFGRHDPTGFEAFKHKLTQGEAKVNAGVLFPHDCVRTAAKGDAQIADQQFAALPDYIPENENIMCLVDTSYSMVASVAGGSVHRIDVAVALGLYCSDRLGEDNPLYRQYMEFQSFPEFVDWRDRSFSDQVRCHDGYIGSTNIQAVLDFILRRGQGLGVTPDQMIKTLVILSDMQFDSHTTDGSQGGYGVGCEGTERTVVEQCMSSWEDAGYLRPQIIYWNLAGYAGQPANLQTPNTVLISGFSPSVLGGVLGGDSFDSLSMMRQSLEKYQVEAPV